MAMPIKTPAKVPGQRNAAPLPNLVTDGLKTGRGSSLSPPGRPSGRGKATELTRPRAPSILDGTLTRHLPSTLFAGIAVLTPLATVCCFADPSVIVSATASPEYSRHKYGGAKTTAESYVVMPGHYFDGGIVDRSIERMPFRRIAEIFAPELARQQYWPAKDAKDADLLIVVHWGTTVPQISSMEMQARTSPLPDLSAVRADKQVRLETAYANPNDAVSGLFAELANEDTRQLYNERLSQLSDQIVNDYSMASSAQLLGYTKDLSKYGKQLMSPAEEYSLRLDLCQMRYFIILRAYDLHAATPAARSRAVWTLHLNISSPGNNFDTAIDRMCVAAVNYVGRSTDEVETVRQPVREGKVEIGPLVILGEAK